MSKDELINNAVYIQFPVNFTRYYNYNVKDIHKLPLPEKDEMYTLWALNSNHYTTAYHRKYVLPLLGSLLNFNYNENDFTLLEKYSNKFDISMLIPK